MKKVEEKEFKAIVEEAVKELEDNRDRINAMTNAVLNKYKKL